MTKSSSIEVSGDETLNVDKPSNLQLFLYYLSFVLLFASLTFVASMLMMGYEDRTGNLEWKSHEMKLSDKIGLTTFYVLQFPLGLLVGLFTGNYHNGLFAFLINPLLIAWTLQKNFKKKQRRIIKRTLTINLVIWIALILTIIIYFVTE